MTEATRRQADEIEARIWPVIAPVVRDDINLGQLRVNILDALEAALTPSEASQPNPDAASRTFGAE